MFNYQIFKLTLFIIYEYLKYYKDKKIKIFPNIQLLNLYIHRNFDLLNKIKDENMNDLNILLFNFYKKNN